MQSSTEAADTQVPDLIGQILGGAYRVLRQLDAGGMGMVYEAEHVRLRRPLAVKIMAGHLSQDQNALARFHREAEIISQLEHPHIVQVVDFDTTPAGQPFLVMELLRGRSLESRLEQGRLPIAEAILIATQAASGLSAAHRSDIVHRDLKPANVFLLDSAHSSPSGGGETFVKLLDFGISKRTGHSHGLTGEFDILGTPDYMAPEQALGRTAMVDHRGDQFALAVITYEMLTGRLPFAADEVMEVLQRVIRDTPTLPSAVRPEVPPSIDDVLLRALSKRPEERFSNIADFAETLSAAFRDAGRVSVPSLGGAAPDHSRPPPLPAQHGPAQHAPVPPAAVPHPGGRATPGGRAESPLALTGLRGALPARPTPPRDLGGARDFGGVDPGFRPTEAPAADRTSLHPSQVPPRELPSPLPSASLAPSASVAPGGSLAQSAPPNFTPGAARQDAPRQDAPRARFDSVQDAPRARFDSVNVEGHSSSASPKPAQGQQGQQGLPGQGLHKPSEPPPTMGPAVRHERRSTSWSKKDPATTVRDLIARAHQELGLDTPELALSYAESALAIADELSTHAEVKQQVEANTRVLERIFERVIGRMDAAISLGEIPSGAAPLSPHQAFLLSRIDGHLTVEEALDLSPLPRMQTLRHLADLLRAGYLRLDRTTIDRPTTRRRGP